MSQEQKTYSFNCNRFKDIALEKYEHNFTFIVNNRQYSTSRVVADLLSPIINNYHYQDESIDEFTITTIEPTDNDYFTDFLELPKIDETKLDDSRMKQYSQYFFELGNYDEFMNLNPEYNEEVTSSNAIQRLRTLLSKFSLHHANNFESRMKDLFKFCSSHFYELPRDEILSLDADTLELIVGSEFLQIESEDSFIEILHELNEKDDNYSKLYEYVLFNNLSDESIEKFISAFNVNMLTKGTWISVCRGLLKKKEFYLNENKRYCQNRENSKVKNKDNVFEIHHHEGQKFEGMMRYLTSKTGGNIHDNGTIEITSNSIYDSSYHPKNLVDYDKSNIYHSNNNENVYIRFDFKTMKIQVDSYSVQSYSSGQNSGNLRNWVVEVSNDSQNWEIIDQHSNDSSLNGASITSTFQTRKPDSFYRFIQIRQTGYSWNGNYYIYFPYLEFYGKLELQ